MSEFEAHHQGHDLSWQRYIVEVPNFPQPGVLFRDITPLLADAQAFAAVIEALAAPHSRKPPDAIAAVESRGFVFGAAVAQRLGCGLVLLRKPGKLPRLTFAAPYQLEYGESTLHMHRDAVAPGASVVVVDDLLATGGTAAAALTLLGQARADVRQLAVVIELTALGGRAALPDVPVLSLVRY